MEQILEQLPHAALDREDAMDDLEELGKDSRGLAGSRYAERPRTDEEALKRLPV